MQDLFARLRRKVYAIPKVCTNRAFSARDEVEELDDWLLDESELDIDKMDYSAPIDQDEAILRQMLAERLQLCMGVLSDKSHKKLEEIVYNNLDGTYGGGMFTK